MPRKVRQMAEAGRKLVFLGPSLELSAAREICPDAEFHPPVRFGDLYALGGEPPGQVLIIDGVFHDSTPVWQREILQLLRIGWRVLGASSMGALRALELEPYGMIGLGTIFEWYRDEAIEGDDEVAMMHGVAEMGYPPLTLPLVDVRHELAELEAEGGLSAPQVSAVLAEFKCMGYETRTLGALLALMDEHGGNVAAMRQRMSGGNRSLKARDARTALRVFAGDLPPPAGRTRWPDVAPPPVQPHSVLEREILPLAGPPVKLADALCEMAQRPDTLERPLRESRRRWFLRDWTRLAVVGPNSDERNAFAVRHATGLAHSLGISLPRWCAASALREDELGDWLEGLAIEMWLAGRTAPQIGIEHALRDGENSLIPAVLVDWMRRNGVEAPPGQRAGADEMASWLVRTGPEFFGALDFDADTALAATLAATGDLARWRGSVPHRAESKNSL